MLAWLLNVPQSQEDWSRWSYNNLDANNQIRQAIQQQFSITLPEYQLDPIGDFEGFLQNNQQAHNDFMTAIGLQSNDLLHTNLQDPAERATWIWLNFWEIQWACQLLKIGP